MVSGFLWEITLNDNYDDGTSSDPDRRIQSMFDDCERALFGDFNVLAPGVQIILEGRPISHSGR